MVLFESKINKTKTKSTAERVQEEEEKSTITRNQTKNLVKIIQSFNAADLEEEKLR